MIDLVLHSPSNQLLWKNKVDIENYNNHNKNSNSISLNKKVKLDNSKHTSNLFKYLDSYQDVPSQDGNRVNNLTSSISS